MEADIIAGVRDRTTRVMYAVLVVVSAGAWMHVVTSMPGGDMAGTEMTMATTLVDGITYVVAGRGAPGVSSTPR